MYLKRDGTRVEHMLTSYAFIKESFFHNHFVLKLIQIRFV